MPQPDYWGKRERAEEAQSLLGSPIFGMAVAQLRADLIDEMLKLPVNDPGVVIVHTKMKLLDEIVGSLERYVNEMKFEHSRRENAA